jgi:hypothetical protein
MFKLINTNDTRNKIQMPASTKHRKIRYFINPQYAQERRKYTILLLKTQKHYNLQTEYLLLQNKTPKKKKLGKE